MTAEFKNNINKTLYFLTHYFPLVFCFSVCMGSGTITGFILSCLTILFMPELQPKKMMPFIISFLIIGNNIENSLVITLVCGILLIIYSLFFNKLKGLFSSGFSSGLMLAGALTATVIFTTDYFGIGATGNNVTEMIKSYISLGFHPNWRGVLYGTIVLVLMITFPRKFKKAGQYFSASFIALIFTLVLNLFLNPSDMTSAITEIPQIEISSLKEFFALKSHTNFNISSVISGVALFIISACSFSSDKNITSGDCLLYSCSDILSCGLFSLPFPYGINKNKKTVAPRIIAVMIISGLFLIFKDIIPRIPLHSCAVIIIVTAWENVKWKEIRSSFSDVFSFLIFVFSFAFSMLTDLSFGTVITFIAILLYNKI